MAQRNSKYHREVGIDGEYLFAVNVTLHLPHTARIDESELVEQMKSCDLYKSYEQQGLLNDNPQNS